MNSTSISKWALALSVALISAMGCSRTTEPDDGSGGTTPPYTAMGNFYMEGSIYLGIFPGNQRFDGTTFELKDTANNNISWAVITVNGDTVPEYYGIYMDTVNVKYMAGATYDISVYIDSSNYFEGSITAPDVDSILIVSPQMGDTIPYDSLTIRWNVFGNSSAPVFVLFGNEEFQVPVGQTEFTIPDSVVLSVVREQGVERVLAVASFNRFPIPELSDSSYLIVGTVNLTQVVIDTLR